jgi:hypothetical protein
MPFFTQDVEHAAEKDEYLPRRWGEGTDWIPAAAISPCEEPDLVAKIKEQVQSQKREILTANVDVLLMRYLTNAR